MYFDRDYLFKKLNSAMFTCTAIVSKYTRWNVPFVYGMTRSRSSHNLHRDNKWMLFIGRIRKIIKKYREQQIYPIVRLPYIYSAFTVIRQGLEGEGEFPFFDNGELFHYTRTKVFRHIFLSKHFLYFPEIQHRERSRIPRVKSSVTVEDNLVNSHIFFWVYRIPHFTLHVSQVMRKRIIPDLDNMCSYYCVTIINTEARNRPAFLVLINVLISI